MQIGPWKKPVRIWLGGTLGGAESVENTLRATGILVHRWPFVRGPEHARACDMCFDVLSGEADPEDARAAFVEAATEASILVD